MRLLRKERLVQEPIMQDLQETILKPSPILDADDPNLCTLKNAGGRISLMLEMAITGGENNGYNGSIIYSRTGADLCRR